jgi:hypothetical protein
LQWVICRLPTWGSFGRPSQRNSIKQPIIVSSVQSVFVNNIDVTFSHRFSSDYRFLCAHSRKKTAMPTQVLAAMDGLPGVTTKLSSKLDVSAFVEVWQIVLWSDPERRVSSHEGTHEDQPNLLYWSTWAHEHPNTPLLCFCSCFCRIA